MGELDCRLHDNLIYENKNGEGKKRKIFGKGKYILWRRKKKEKDEEENIWRGKTSLLCIGGRKTRVDRATQPKDAAG